MTHPIKSTQFYGKAFGWYKTQFEKRLKDHNKPVVKKLRLRMPDSLAGPTQFWAEFSKQAEALETIKERNSKNEPLSTFVYQDKDGFRHFVVAHPVVYWWYYNLKPPERRCTYEVIRENEPCSLYFDLEFIKEKNPEHNGPDMVAMLIEIVSLYMLKYWSYHCNKKRVVNLDSTTDVKFSRHLIFCMKDVAFINNFQVGKFVKKICSDLMKYLFHKVDNDILKLFKEEDLFKLVIETNNGKKIFIDTSVYSKNRHFRIYKSTKWGKESHLVMAPDSEYVPNKDRKDKELQIFLDSLISYFPNTETLHLLEFNDGNNAEIQPYSEELIMMQQIKVSNCITTTQSQYPMLDHYIADFTKPGKIRMIKYFESLNILVYELYGNRYCRNIGRSHKSNNIYWVVDLLKKVMFQKCHDEDCAGFMSEPHELPENIKFFLDEESDAFLSSLPSPEELIGVENENEDMLTENIDATCS